MKDHQMMLFSIWLGVIMGLLVAILCHCSTIKDLLAKQNLILLNQAEKIHIQE